MGYSLLGEFGLGNWGDVVLCLGVMIVVVVWGGYCVVGVVLVVLVVVVFGVLVGMLVLCRVVSIRFILVLLLCVSVSRCWVSVLFCGVWLDSWVKFCIC